MANNLNQNEMVNSQVPQQPVRQEPKKRERKVLEIFDEHGNKLDLEQLAKNPNIKVGVQSVRFNC